MSIILKPQDRFFCHPPPPLARRHPSIPRVYIYKEFQKCKKCVRNMFVNVSEPNRRAKSVVVKNLLLLKMAHKDVGQNRT